MPSECCRHWRGMRRLTFLGLILAVALAGVYFPAAEAGKLPKSLDPELACEVRAPLLVTSLFGEGC